MTTTELLRILQDPTIKPRPNRGVIVETLRSTGHKDAMNYANEVASTPQATRSPDGCWSSFPLLQQSSTTSKAVSTDLDIDVDSSVIDDLLQYSNDHPRHQVTVKGKTIDGYTRITYKYPVVDGKGTAPNNELHDFYRTLARAAGIWDTNNETKSRNIAKALTHNPAVRG